MLLWEGKWAIVAVPVWAKQTRLRVLEQLTMLMQMMPTARCPGVSQEELVWTFP